jgi:hypothetical protein
MWFVLPSYAGGYGVYGTMCTALYLPISTAVGLIGAGDLGPDACEIAVEVVAEVAEGATELGAAAGEDGYRFCEEGADN